MNYLPLNTTNCPNIPYSKGTILIFTEGTILGPVNIWNFFNYKKYIPIGKCVNKIQDWHDQSWNIVYLTSRRSNKEVNEIKSILEKYNFPGDKLYYRNPKEHYKDIAEKIVPNVLIEDDCRSIGGKWQMTITYVKKEIKNKIKSIVVKEFRGIDYLPSNTKELLQFKIYN